jgi:hypothetical protein
MVNINGNPAWVPGKSGNPLGRPPKPLPSYLEKARAAAEEAIDMLVRALREADDWDVRIRAGKEILDRAYGKALQQTEVTANGDISVVVSMVLGAQQKAAIDVTSKRELDDAAD